MNYDLYARTVRMIFTGSFRRQLSLQLGNQTAGEIMRKAKQHYREIVKYSPSIGGRENPLSMNLLVVVYAVAIYKAADGRLAPEQMGEVFSKAIEQTRIFRLFTKMKGKRSFTRQWQNRRNAAAIASQKKIYPADWVSEFIYGKTVNEFGITYRECGICKLLQRENCTEIAPQMCKFDYVTAKYMGCTLIRNKTIGNGDELCDFWFTKN